MTRVASVLALVAVLAIAAPATAGEPYKSLLDQKAEMVVSVKFVLNTTINFGGRSQDQETTSTANGILVDKSGLVMIPGSSISAPSFFGGGGRRGGRGDIDIKATPSDFRVIFAGDTKEYPAILGASDTKVGLAFVRIKDLEGKEIRPLVAETAAEPDVGDTLYGVSRLPQGFDYAPYVDHCHVSGRIAKPRVMWNVDGSFMQVAHPLFTKDGVVTGILVSQEGVGGGSGIFLLPWKTAAGTIPRALTASEAPLEESNKMEAAEAAKPKEEKPAEAPADGPSDKPEEKPEDKPGDKPEDKPSDAPGGTR
jgi:hypothetical protein